MEANGAVKCIRMMAPCRPWITQRPSQSVTALLVPSRLHGGNVTGSEHRNSTFMGVHTHAHKMCLWLFCSSSSCKLIPVRLDFSSCSNPSPSPIVCHRVGRCSLTCGLQMAVLCDTARKGVTVPCAKQLPGFATWQFYSNESHSVELNPHTTGLWACLQREHLMLWRAAHSPDWSSLWG